MVHHCAKFHYAWRHNSFLNARYWLSATSNFIKTTQEVFKYIVWPKLVT